MEAGAGPGVAGAPEGGVSRRRVPGKGAGLEHKGGMKVLRDLRAEPPWDVH